MIRSRLIIASLFLGLLPACQTDFGTNDEENLGGNALVVSESPEVQVQPEAAAPKVVATRQGLWQTWLGASVVQALGTTGQIEMSKIEKNAYTAPIGLRLTWKNADKGLSGEITATDEAYASTGAFCRSFQMIVTTKDVKKQAVGKACQMKNGAWQAVQSY